MIAIIDYGVGNLYSLSHSLTHLGLDCQVTRDEEIIRKAERLILPGVGAFGDAMNKLEETGLIPLIKKRVEEGTPLFGICLGMQLLFEKSYEYGEHPGLGFLPGQVCPLREDIPGDMMVPQIGWNDLTIHRPHPLLKNVEQGDSVYYVHSFYAKNVGESLVASSDYGVQVPGLVAKGNVAGAQFHPEKSGSVGLAMLKAFATWKGEEKC